MPYSAEPGPRTSSARSRSNSGKPSAAHSWVPSDGIETSRPSTRVSTRRLNGSFNPRTLRLNSYSPPWVSSAPVVNSSSLGSWPLADSRAISSASSRLVAAGASTMRSGRRDMAVTVRLSKYDAGQSTTTSSVTVSPPTTSTEPVRSGWRPSRKVSVCGPAAALATANRPSPPVRATSTRPGRNTLTPPTPEPSSRTTEPSILPVAAFSAVSGTAASNTTATTTTDDPTRMTTSPCRWMRPARRRHRQGPVAQTRNVRARNALPAASLPGGWHARNTPTGGRGGPPREAVFPCAEPPERG